jgi:hypothetical protein
MKINFLTVLPLLAACIVVGCASPEASRTRGGGPGADVGNRAESIEMHEGSDPFYQTPQIIASQHAPIASARQADQLSRR